MASPVPLLPVIADVCDTPPPVRAAGPSHRVKGLPPVLHSYVEAPSPTGKEQSHGVSPSHLEGCSPPSSGGRKQQDHQGIWNTMFPPTLKSKRCWQGSISWCPSSCSPPCCPFARVSVKECLMWLCRAHDQRCLLGPFVFSSWDLMAWMLLKIFFWWPIMVIPRLRTSLGNKDTVKDTCSRPQGDNCTPWTSPGTCAWLFTCPSAQGWSCWGSMGTLPGTERLPFPWACPPDEATLTALWGAGAGSLLTGW